ncbi:YraN family protein [Myxococcota bacterium]|nr:YraN family protein [Myxococcota bacterium]
MPDPDDPVEVRRRALAQGALAERLVAERLVAGGWEILARNWRGGGGELDLVVARHGRLRMVEVKARAPDDPVGLEAIDAGKRRRLRGAAQAFLAQWEDLVDEVCFTVALVHLPSAELQGLDPAGLLVEWLDDAFDA